MSFSPRDSDAEEREQKWKEYWEACIEELPLLPNSRPRALTPDPPILTSHSKVGCGQAPLPLDQNSCHWFKIPPYVRRDILRLAFGDTRLHMYMHHERPDVARQPESKYHCRIIIKPGEYPGQEVRAVDETQSRSWQWWGSRCHLSLPGATDGHGGPMTRGGLKGPWADDCRGGGDSDICEAWRQQDGPSACHIGVMGWLLSCRQNYLETIEVLYSTNTLVLGGPHMITHLSQLILPQRLELMTSLEITWPLKTKVTPDQSYDDLDREHLESILNMISPAQFPALRRLYVWLSESDAWLAVSGLGAYQKTILEHMDSFARRMTHLNECAFAIPAIFFKTIYCNATEVSQETDEWGSTMYTHADSYRQAWRGLNGEMTVVLLPYVDSYPKPPYHLLKDGNQVAGYWILEASDDPLREKSPYRDWCGSGSRILGQSVFESD